MRLPTRKTLMIQGLQQVHHTPDGVLLTGKQAENESSHEFDLTDHQSIDAGWNGCLFHPDNVRQASSLLLCTAQLRSPIT
jgi:hypothetical protein